MGEGMGMISGGRLENFAEGWALAMHGKAHYFAPAWQTSRVVRSLCGTKYAYRVQVFGVGSFDKCKSCSRMAAALGDG